MDGSSFPPNNNHPPMFGNIDEFMDQLLDEGSCWLQTIPPGSSISQSEPSIPMSYSPPYKYSTDMISVPHGHQAADKGKWDFSINPPPSNSSVDRKGAEEDEVVDRPDQSRNHQTAIQATSKSSLLCDSSDFNRIWMAAFANPGPSSSSSSSVELIKQRFESAVLQFKELSEDKDVLIQIWVPIKKEHKNFLTTVAQPYFRDPSSTRLVNYRNVSEKYQFLADEESKKALGLPGRVYLGKAPEWTPDVRFFGPDEYPRITYAHKYHVRGSIALPVFERGSTNCIGVAELVMTTQKVNYRPQVETLCKALEAVDLKSSDIHRASKEKAPSESHKAALPELLNVLRIICDRHNLPLAQTWAPCIQQSKGGCWNFDKKSHCISIIDSACYIRDPQVSGFHEACSEHHLIGNQGTVGQAFVTNQPSFATDVTAFSKSDYPLAHHAKMFGLQAAVAIPIRSTIYNNSDAYTDFVLEFFLPLQLKDAGLTFHFKVIRSLSMVIQKGCQNLQLIVPEEGIQEKPMFSFKENMSFSLDRGKVGKEDSKLQSAGSKQPSSSNNEELGRSWISEMVEAKRKGKEVAVSWGCREEEQQKEGFKLTTDWNDHSDTELFRGQLFPGFANVNHDYGADDVIEGSFFGEHLSLGSSAARKASEKRKTKAHKTISLQVLRQYFSGSLKDAAKDLGVCPTTLKRICRQHGITRWPSRKIKKVGHSLKKLQMVIDSVQGAEGAIKLSSFYSNFPELSSPNFPSTNGLPLNTCANDQAEQQITSTLATDQGNMFCTSKSPSTSSSQTSGSSHPTSKEVKTSPTAATAAGAASGSGGDTSTPENPPPVSVSLKRARSEAHLHRSHQKVMNNLLLRSQSNRSTKADYLTIETRPPVLATTSFALRDGGSFKAKATFGEETIRFSVLPNMGFGDVRLEIAKRFNIDDATKIQIKYLDDCKEWVLLTCDDDLDECIDIQRSTGSRTAKLSVHHVHLRLGTSFGNSGQS